ncbi:MAG: DUF2514 family protein [Candidatus Saelkia tenebricola]|nr:DUF2514 family protein [Candidatus Saelkia tenebricola]
MMTKGILCLVLAIFLLTSCSWAPFQSKGEFWGNEGYMLRDDERDRIENASEIARLREELEKERRAQEEADRKIREETERRAQEEIALRAQKETERKAQEASKLQQKEQVKEDTCPDVAYYPILIADFNSGKKPNNLGEDFGCWDKDPNDYTQTATESFIADIQNGNKKGFFIEIHYDVNSPNPAFNGFWTRLNNLDASCYKTLSFRVKGNERMGFTKVFKIELKNSKRETGIFYVNNVSNEWQEIIIPLKDIRIKELSGLREFVIVFEDSLATEKEGTICIDDIYLR